MNRESAFFILLAVILSLVGCHPWSRVYVISTGEELLLPFRASLFFGYFSKEGIELRIDRAKSKEELIKLLNLSKYTVAVTDRKTGKKVESLSGSWRVVCTVAVKIRNGKPIKEETFVLIVRKSLLERERELLTVLKGWNYGVELLKDPAVVYYLTGNEELNDVKLLKCQGSR